MSQNQESIVSVSEKNTQEEDLINVNNMSSMNTNDNIDDTDTAVEKKRMMLIPLLEWKMCSSKKRNKLVKLNKTSKGTVDMFSNNDDDSFGNIAQIIPILTIMIQDTVTDAQDISPVIER